MLEIFHPEWFKYVNKFPSDIFGCKENCYEYYNTIYTGIERMKNYRVVFCGLCHNIEKKIPDLIKRVERTGSMFKDYSMVIFENDSTDNTRNLLNKWCINNNKVKLVPCDTDINCKLKRARAINKGVISENRMKYMSEYRDNLFNYVRAYYHDYDYIISFDLDIKGPWMNEGFAHTFGINTEWDGIFAYGLTSTFLTLNKPIYYDLLAYADDNIKTFHDKNIKDVIINPLKIAYKLSNLKNKNLIPVKSAFAGVGIYKMKILKNSNINYIPKDGKYICEHVIFHNNMRDNGYDKLYINPYLVILVGGQGLGS